MADSFDFNNLAQHADYGHDEPSPGSPHSDHHDDIPMDTSNLSTRHPHHPSNITVYQTTGPDAHTGPTLSPGTNNPAVNPRSCVTCRRRKVRCDKQMPCSNCRRALIPCVFPAPGRAPRQPRPKDPNAPPKNSSQRELELTKRLRKLEGIVEELSSQIEVESGGKSSSAAESPDTVHAGSFLAHRQMSGSVDGSAMTASPRTSETTVDQLADGKKPDMSKKFGRLVLNDRKGSSRYVSSGFWSKLNDEVGHGFVPGSLRRSRQLTARKLDSLREEAQKITDNESDYSDHDETPELSPDDPESASYDHHAFILGYRSADVDLQKYHPPPAHVSFMWSVYMENVEPLIKIFHAPTIELLIRDARKNCEKLTPGQLCLVFSIYYSAVVALEPDECETNFNVSRDKLISKYRFALEQALAKANFLNTSDLMVVQAFTLFLIVVRRHDESRFCWALTGLLIRIAMGMGIHRDGTNFKLSPFETELRRRLWWNIVALDLRSAEELGTDLTITDRIFDTKLPSNINDGDITAESTDFPPEREGRSDIAVPRVRYEITTMSRRLLAAASAQGEACPNGNTNDLSVMERERMLIDVYQKVEHKFLKHVVDESDPLYWVAAMIARIIMAKMCLVIYQPMLFPGSEVELSDDVRQRIYVAAIEIVEYNHRLNTDDRCRQYRWLFMTYTNWHAIAYVLLETCRRPWTALVERGWEAVNGYARHPLSVAKHSDHTAVFLPLRNLFYKANRHRTAEIARLKANQDEARNLDFQERMNPAYARFGPVPGSENRMEEVREKWRHIMRPDGASPMPFTARARTPQPPQMSLGSSSLPPPLELAQQLAQQQSQNQASAMPNGNQLNVPGELSNVAVDYIQDMIMNQPNLNMTDLWNLNSENNAMSQSSVPLSGMMPTAGAQSQNSLVDDAALRQQALALQTQPPKDDILPPYLWSDPFTAMNTRLDEPMPAEDTDMLGDEFDWQDWSQSIRGLEMENTQNLGGW